MVATITSDREKLIHHTTGDSAICVIGGSGCLVTVVSVSRDLVLHKGLVKLESDYIKVDLGKKVMAVFCVKCETMSEGAVQHTSHYSRQHLASGVVKVCSREGCQQAFQTWHLDSYCQVYIDTWKVYTGTYTVAVSCTLAAGQCCCWFTLWPLKRCRKCALMCLICRFCK